MNVLTKRTLGLFMVAALAVWTFTGVFSLDGEAVAATQADENIAPDFVLKDLTGRDVRLSQYRGRPVLLVFGTTWCPECRTEIPSIKDIHSRYGPKGLVVLYIDVLESQNKIAAFVKRHALPYAALLDTQGKVMDSYGVRGVPVKVLINREGRIICWNCRSLPALLEKQFGDPFRGKTR
jgi:peroxiredoxin